MKRIYISNERETASGRARFIKVDANDPSVTLAGAIFDLYMRNEKRGCYCELQSGFVTQADGTLIIDRLKAGKYMLVESKAPNGYAFENIKVFFAIGTNGGGEISGTDTILIPNRPKKCGNCCGKDYCCHPCGGCGKVYSR